MNAPSQTGPNDAAPPEKPSRADRLAARLRENLHRRKAQARAMAAGSEAAPTEPAAPDAAGIDSGRLPKASPES